MSASGDRRARRRAQRYAAMNEPDLQVAVGKLLDGWATEATATLRRDGLDALRGFVGKRREEVTRAWHDVSATQRERVLAALDEIAAARTGDDTEDDGRVCTPGQADAMVQQWRTELLRESRRLTGRRCAALIDEWVAQVEKWNVGELHKARAKETLDHAYCTAIAGAWDGRLGPPHSIHSDAYKLRARG